SVATPSDVIGHSLANIQASGSPNTGGPKPGSPGLGGPVSVGTIENTAISAPFARRSRRTTRILILSCSVREVSYSRLLDLLGCEVRLFVPKCLPLSLRSN